MIEELHIAAQYLAAAGVSFLEKKEDDSHTNLEWSVNNAELSTWPLTEGGDQLALNYNNFSLVWISAGKREELPLDGISHEVAMKWINEMAQARGLNKTYQYKLHYELPYPFPQNADQFQLKDKKELESMIGLMNMAQGAMEKALNHHGLKSGIRVWPHHFDLGAFAQVDDSISIGFGMAIPDSSINDFYFYVSGYRGHDALETKDFNPLSHGEWQKGDWKAATLKASESNEAIAQGFLNEAINAFING